MALHQQDDAVMEVPVKVLNVIADRCLTPLDFQLISCYCLDTRITDFKPIFSLQSSTLHTEYL